MPKRMLKNPDEFTSFELAAELGVSRQTIQVWVKTDKIPAPAKMIGNKRVWSADQVRDIKKLMI